jgi:hypothetical protein
MTEERNIKNHQSLDDDYYFILNENINELDERKRHNWVRDDLTDKCLSCEKYFSIFRRRHHCRFCGGIFCYECSGYSIEIPKFIESCPKPDVNPYDFKNYIE